MITDARMIFANNMDLTADAYATNEINFGIADPNQGAGTPLWVHITVGTAFATIVTVIFSLRFGAATDPTVPEMTSRSIAIAEMTAGARLWDAPLPKTFARYCRLYSDVSTDATAGTLNAWIDMTPG